MGERKALVVGINNYPTCPLNGCCNDSEAIKDLLSNHGNGDPNFSIWKKDNVATKGELRGLIEKCFEGDADVASAIKFQFDLDPFQKHILFLFCGKRTD
ncbi:caspase family protein [Ruminococcus sp.]|uniref:caspase family protein n=1 Tax=Ruminococcus sp. TaxID=41978 RepID=UPI0035276FD2